MKFSRARHQVARQVVKNTAYSPRAPQGLLFSPLSPPTRSPLAPRCHWSPAAGRSKQQQQRSRKIGWRSLGQRNTTPRVRSAHRIVKTSERKRERGAADSRRAIQSCLCCSSDARARAIPYTFPPAFHAHPPAHQRVRIIVCAIFSVCFSRAYTERRLCVL